MQALAFDDVLAALEALPLCTDDLVRLRAWIASIADPGECIALIEQATDRPPCPRCRHTRVQRCGSASGLQRYRCCRCGRGYNALSGTPLARGAVHLQNVNGWHSRFKTWLLRFRGVASRYLIDYSGWQRMLDDKRLTTPALLVRAAVQFGKRLDRKRN